MALDENLKIELTKWFGPRVMFDEPMSKHTSLKVGGPADAMVMPEDEQELAGLLQRLNEIGISYFVVGKGTNLLVKDRGIRGVVISLAGKFSTIESRDEEEGHVRVSAKAGARLSGLCGYALKNGLSGMNFALGIPGSVGGAVLMNAGASGGAVCDVLDTVSIMHRDGKAEKVHAPRMRWSYRSCMLMESSGTKLDNFILTSGEFLLKRGDAGLLRREARRIVQNRKTRQPMEFSSAGCFFKNPVKGEPAGRLIDMAGLKGFRIGDAEVSSKHANFIINRGKASAKDITGVAEKVRKTVLDKFQVSLEPEVKIVGE